GSRKQNGEGLSPFPTLVLPARGMPPQALALRRESALGLLGDRAKRGGIVDGDVGQGLAVQGDVRLEQPIHEAAVAQAVHAGRGVDAHDPQAAELALLLLAADVRVLLGLGDGLLGDAEDLATGVVVALRELDDFLVTAARRYTTLDSCHFSVLLRDRAAGAAGDRNLRRGRGSSGGDCAYAWCSSW